MFNSLELLRTSAIKVEFEWAKEISPIGNLSRALFGPNPSSIYLRSSDTSWPASPYLHLYTSPPSGLLLNSRTAAWSSPQRSLQRTLKAPDPVQVFQRAPVQVDDGADHHHVHDLVAVAPVVEEARAQPLGHLHDVDHPPQHRQRVHDEEEPERPGASHALAVHPEQEEAEAEHRLPHEGPQPQHVGACGGGAVDAVGGQEDVDEQRELAHARVTQQGDVDDW